MGILQAILALITRSAGKILNAIFGWAVHAMFGRTTPRDQTILSAIVGAAVVWPLLALGVAAPKVAAFALAFVPIPHAVPSWIVRIVWLSLALIVPLALGAGIAARGRRDGELAREGTIKRLLRGFPLTLGLAIAFLVMFVSVPLMRVAALVRRQKSTDVPLATDAEAYHHVARLVVETLNRHGFALHAAEPGWWVKAPTRILSIFGGSAFGAFVPQRLEHHEAPDLAVSFYTSGVLLRGKGPRMAWAHGLIEEAIVHTEGLQTTAPEAQELEREIRKIWKAFDVDPVAHRGSSKLLDRAHGVTKKLAALDVEYDEWQALYRQLLQLDRGLRGEHQLLEDERLTPEATSAPALSALALKTIRPFEKLSTSEIVRVAVEDLRELTKTQIQLAKTEARSELQEGVGMAKRLGVAAFAAIVGVNLLFVTAALGLATVLPGWLAALFVCAFVGIGGGIMGAVGWGKRVRVPMERTRHELKENVRWTKERMA